VGCHGVGFNVHPFYDDDDDFASVIEIEVTDSERSSPFSFQFVARVGSASQMPGGGKKDRANGWVFQPHSKQHSRHDAEEQRSETAIALI
jgi:hypothetical protein